MGKKANPAVVGAFVLGAVALAVLGVLVFGSGKYFRSTTHWVMYFPGSIDGLSVGAPVKFKGVDLGTVTKIELVLSAADAGATARIPVYVEIDPSRIVAGAGFHRGPAVREELIKRGLRAQLQSQSLLTGLLFIQLDLFPDTPTNYVLPQPSDPPEIPTIPTLLEQGMVQARALINDLKQIDFKGLVARAESSLDGISRLANDPALKQALAELPGTVEKVNGAVDSAKALLQRVDRQIDPLSAEARTTLAGAQRAMSSVEKTASAATTLIEPGSPLDYDLRQALREVGSAAGALRLLADYLERNPSALLYGKAPTEGRKP
jgi:paraquat-inducible protein B